MFRQHHPAVDNKRMPCTHLSDDGAQHIDMARQQFVAVAFKQIDGKKVSAAEVPCASVIGHVGSIAMLDMRRNALRLLRPSRAQFNY
jgi:hypothetical protein